MEEGVYIQFEQSKSNNGAVCIMHPGRLLYHFSLLKCPDVASACILYTNICSFYGIKKVPSIVKGTSCIFGAGFPYTSALLGFPAERATGSGESLSGGLSVLLGLGIADFIVIHGAYSFFFCALIIACFVSNNLDC